MTKQSDAETPGKGILPNLDESIKGFRKGVTKRSILKSWDKEDWKRHAERDHFQSFDINSVTGRIHLQNDTVRVDRDIKIDNVAEMMNEIRNALSSVERKQKQIDVGKVTELLKEEAIIRDGESIKIERIIMTENELKLEVSAGKRIIEKNRRRIAAEFGSLRNLVGSHDLMKNPIMTEEDYDTFVLKTEKELKELGVDLFDKELHK